MNDTMYKTKDPSDGIDAIAELHRDRRTLERQLADARKMIKRLRDERRWDAFCAALTGYRANTKFIASAEIASRMAKGDADAAVRVMYGEEER